ncbi:hypothetical protein [Lentilitoribacter sp. EG35]|jgi:hypothetical protein|uniref:hypothetical protein n=1 Tax=Lentilitoribacter sp. EG35 TaxID=3234192 RepID=UPI00345FF575
MTHFEPNIIGQFCQLLPILWLWFAGWFAKSGKAICVVGINRPDQLKPMSDDACAKLLG